MGKRLTLSIKQQFFNEILSGDKKVEMREIRPNNVAKYCQMQGNGTDVLIENDRIMPVAYNELKLVTGQFKGKRPFLIVDVEDINVVLYTDDDGNYETYEFDGVEYAYAEIHYQLGELKEEFNPKTVKAS